MHERDELVAKAAESVPDAHWCESNYTKGCNCREYREEVARAVLAAVRDEIAAGALREAADAVERSEDSCRVQRTCHKADAILLRDRADRLTGGAS